MKEGGDKPVGDEPRLRRKFSSRAAATPIRKRVRAEGREWNVSSGDMRCR
jgi:hypothetical protein